MNNQEATTYIHQSEEFGEVVVSIEKIDDVPQPHHLYFVSRIDGEYRKQIAIDIVAELRKALSPKQRRSKLIWQKEHAQVPLIPIWRPHDLR